MIPINLLIFFLVAAGFVSSEIIKYDNHYVFSDEPEYLIIPKYAKGEVPHWSPGKGRSYIDLSRIYLKSACYIAENNLRPPPPKDFDNTQCRTSQFDVLMFEAPLDKSWEDYWEDGDYCCTQDLVNSGKCNPSKLNTLIVPSSLPGTFLRSVKVKPDEVVPLIDENDFGKHMIEKSGLYVIVMASCDSNSPPIAVDGSIDSLDPYGYLPADMFGNFPFYLSLSCMYLIIAVTWAVLCSFYSDQLMPLQIWISAVLAIAMIETTVLFSHYLDWNDNGFPALSITFIGLVFGVTKRAISRVLVQLVALGYGVVRPSLGEDMTRVLYLGGTYFVLSLIYTLMVNLPHNTKSVGDPEYDIVSLVVFLLAVVDTTFYIWIFTSINNLMVSLAARKQGVKYVLYRNFRGVLFVMLFLTCVWAVYGSFLFLNDSSGTNKNWREKWTVDALWELIYFVVFVSIAVLWAPSSNSQRYAYSIELAQLDDDSEWNEVQDAEMAANIGDNDNSLDDEYGGRLNDEKDPFQGKGALDPLMAITKKA